MLKIIVYQGFGGRKGTENGVQVKSLTVGDISKAGLLDENRKEAPVRVDFDL